MIMIRPAVPAFAEEWLQMRQDLWPEESREGLRQDIEEFFAGRARHLRAVLFAHDDTAGRILGFTELNIRTYAEGCTTDRIAFLEGWYVQPESRTWVSARR